jgi:Asp23 family, cell envelope-related function
MPGDRLACGTSITDLLASVADGVPPPDPDHSATCRLCRDALDRLEGDWRLVREAAAVVVPPPARVEDRVLRRVRSLVATGWVAMGDGGLGRTSVSEAALALVAEHEAAGVSGVEGVRASTVRVDDAGALQVDVEVTVAWRSSIHDVADRVRRAVAHRILVTAGLAIERVDVTVSDVRGR